MKKLVLILELILGLCAKTEAKIYHGIDIDAVYESSDWSSKEKIKEIIDDYTLLLQYEKELPLCYQNSEKLSCINNLAENSIKHFYVGNTNDNLKNYNNYVKSTYASYGILYCLNKYKIPSGTMCNQENNARVWKIIEEYINEMLQQIKQDILKYSFIQNYKD